MAKYAVFFRFTGAAVKGLVDKPSDRAAVVSALCESGGGRMEAYYIMFGDWDGFVIAELPDSNAAAAFSLAVSASGAFAQLSTHELLDATQLTDALSKAASLQYTPPGN
jgi:uncharacterized protein with GYD domain